MVLTGIPSQLTTLKARDILDKDLTYFSVSDAYGYSDAVINMLLHGAVNLDYFDKEVISEYDPVAILKDRSESLSSSNRGKMTILKMIL